MTWDGPHHGLGLGKIWDGSKYHASKRTGKGDVATSLFIHTLCLLQVFLVVFLGARLNRWLLFCYCGHSCFCCFSAYRVVCMSLGMRAVSLRQNEFNFLSQPNSELISVWNLFVCQIEIIVAFSFKFFT